MSTFGKLVEIDQFGISALRPTPRGRVDLVGKDADCRGDRDVLGSKKWQLALPIETSGRDCRVRQPIERDVVEDIGAGQPLVLSIEDARDELVTARVVIEHPGR